MVIADSTTVDIDNRIPAVDGGPDGRPLKPGTKNCIRAVLSSKRSPPMRRGWIPDSGEQLPGVTRALADGRP